MSFLENMLGSVSEKKEYELIFHSPTCASAWCCVLFPKYEVYLDYVMIECGFIDEVHDIYCDGCKQKCHDGSVVLSILFTKYSNDISISNKNFINNNIFIKNNDNVEEVFETNDQKINIDGLMTMISMVINCTMRETNYNDAVSFSTLLLDVENKKDMLHEFGAQNVFRNNDIIYTEFVKFVFKIANKLVPTLGNQFIDIIDSYVVINPIIHDISEKIQYKHELKFIPIYKYNDIENNNFDDPCMFVMSNNC